MDYEKQNREAACSLGDLVEALFDELTGLPISGPAKESLVTIMLGDIMRREGRTIIFQARPWPISGRVAA